jgi:hypothetical protein
LRLWRCLTKWRTTIARRGCAPSAVRARGISCCSCSASAASSRYGTRYFNWCGRFTPAFIPTIGFDEFWRRGISTRSLALSLLMMFAPVPGAMTLGFMLGNLMAWFISPARRTLDVEAKGYPGTSFRDSMLGLARICLWTLPTGLCVAFIAAYSLSSLR